MADYSLALGSFAVLAGAALGAWRLFAGPARSSARAIGRAVLVVSFALAIVGAGTYLVTKSRPFQLAGELVRRIETSERVVALTFDDGPTPGYTDEVLRTLKAHDASATFYLTGRECEANPEATRAIIDSGNEIGNHTCSHGRLYFVSEATVADEVERCDTIIRAAGYEGPLTFRMPGCKRLLTAPLYLARTGRTTVTWDVEPDSIEEVAADPDALADHVVDSVRPGSIVLMHVMYESREPTRRALPRILERLSRKGYRFVTVSELLALRH